LTKAAAALLATLLLLPALIPGEAEAAGSLVLRCGIRNYVETNPLIADAESWRILGLVYDKATGRHPETGELIPYIAVGSANTTLDQANLSWGDCVVGDFGYTPRESWKDPSKPEAVIFYDFEGVRWHDGYPMTVRDVMFSLHAGAAPEIAWLGNPLMDDGGPGNYSRDQWLFAEKVWESADSTRAALRFTLQTPFYSVFERYLSTHLLPYHIWGNMVANQFVDNATIWCDPGYDSADPRSWKAWAAAKWANPWPIGSGRFRWAGSTDSAVTLQDWDSHFTGPGFKYRAYGAGAWPEPAIDAISLQVNQQEAGALQALEADELDMLAWDIPRAAAEAYAGSDTVGLASLRGTGMTYLGFNMGRTSFGYDQRFTDPERTGDVGKPLRRAVSHCVNRAAMLSLTTMLAEGAERLDTFHEWENSSAPAHAFDPGEAANILRKAGYLLTEPSRPPGAGNWWMNPDRTQIGGRPDGTIEVLMSDRGSQAATVGTMLVNQMRSIGLNAELLQLDAATVAELVGNGEFDMFIAEMDLPEVLRVRPENMLYGRLHTKSIYTGENEVGYRNASFDRAVDLAMATTDRQSEKALFKDAHASLAYDMPYYPLFYDTAIQLYREDNFSGFVDDGSGSLLNPLSMASVRKEGKLQLKARFLGMPLTMLSNSTFDIVVKVTASDGNAVPGAELSLECTAGELSAGEGATGENGLLRLVYRAPAVQDSPVTSSGVPVVITLNPASAAGFRESDPRSAMILVYPTGTPLLLVSASLAQDVVYDRDASGAAGFTYLDITVKDPNNLPVEDADITLGINGTALVPDEAEMRTDEGGFLRVRLTAADIDTAEEIAIGITASKAYFISGGAQASIVVMPYTDSPPAIQVIADSTFGTALAAGMGVAAALAVCATYLFWRKRRGKKE
jgi:ABC-type transport system substrate-binding protein